MTIILHFSNKLGLSPNFVYKTIRLAPHSYKKFSIPKKNGGTRIVHQPSKKVKALQILAVEEFFSKLPVHSCVYSYKKNTSIINCANKHKANNYLLRLDFKNFFESITNRDIKLLLKNNAHYFPIKLDNEDITLLSLLSCCSNDVTNDLRVVIGAPSSPSISNAILYEFDSAIDAFCHNMSITYTRYADDLFFSTNNANILTKVKRKVVDTLNNLQHPKLTLNHKKTYHTSRKHRKIVTGLTLTPEKTISIGRERKREIKSLIFDFSNKELPLDKLEYLKGLLSFTHSAEPRFIESLRKKYGNHVIAKLWH
ncbi:retron St85 family RNA-directed DNA polymerase [Chromobacterium haemolyticum]|uniref:retron St85 family RNA-directed DNA polymerase n=1 Tax=Chromobacterium haemolyticum TaxID=394935 RepID=UPI00244ACE14|nr:retron St85 family RNA-directed DNA polymerase [Chromobacterium haemolyticum]MDH0340343.1 retron St85 family RNA-directed DNA polymerase [Chromobacterium haemolyticum]